MIDMLYSIFCALLAVLMLAGIFCTALGLLTVFHWVKKPIPPNDLSNRINNIKSWWIGLTRPDVLGRSYDEFSKDVLAQIETK